MAFLNDHTINCPFVAPCKQKDKRDVKCKAEMSGYQKNKNTKKASTWESYEDSSKKLYILKMRMSLMKNSNGFPENASLI